MTTALLTGGGGFVGQWLTRALLQRGNAVISAGFESVDGPRPQLLTLEEQKAVRYVTADMRRPQHVDAMIDAAQPDVVYHLAAVAFPPDADSDPAAAYDVNTLGAVRLLAALALRKRAGTLDPITLIIGSALQYGLHDPAKMPLTESAEQRPPTVYAASKAAQEIVALQAARANDLRVVCTRSFNHGGPGQPGYYLLPSLVRRVLDMRGSPARHSTTLSIGKDVTRDFLHVADVAAAYMALAERGRAGETYNVASGKGVRVSHLASDILRGAGVTADVSSDRSLARATDIPVLVGSPAKLMEHTGWAPTKTHADIIDDLLRFANATTD
jgi:GDP-4-dehydro-6-deoxy-D-mannose reductase